MQKSGVSRKNMQPLYRPRVMLDTLPRFAFYIPRCFNFSSFPYFNAITKYINLNISLYFTYVCLTHSCLTYACLTHTIFATDVYLFY